MAPWSQARAKRQSRSTVLGDTFIFTVVPAYAGTGTTEEGYPYDQGWVYLGTNFNVQDPTRISITPAPLYNFQVKRFDVQEPRVPGDLLMWDNRCSVHARTDFPREERRMLRRLTVSDEHPVLEGEPPYREAVGA